MFHLTFCSQMWRLTAVFLLWKPDMKLCCYYIFPEINLVKELAKHQEAAQRLAGQTFNKYFTFYRVSAKTVYTCFFNFSQTNLNQSYEVLSLKFEIFIFFFLSGPNKLLKNCALWFQLSQLFSVIFFCFLFWFFVFVCSK